MPSLFRLIAPKPRPTRDTLSVLLPDGRNVDITRVRDPRARRLRLSVDERGARLSLPLRASLVSGDRFVAEHSDWLARQIDHFAMDAVPRLVRGETAALPLRGEQVPLRWAEGRYARLSEDEHGLIFALPARGGDAAMRRTLRDFYEAQGRADLGRWLPKYVPGLPRSPSRVTFKVMSSQWGSLSPDGVMVLDLALVLGQPAAFEYVLVHELCHLIHADHSRAFWREVGARFPAWRDQRGYFHAEGRRLKAGLRGLLSA
ncbi:M48 family metallopeptidase [Luteimonas sp. SX5]|uniref:M48 family metallopeptidase n=1 Tax=Luteimonas galliterrae TaxID=2940486 RepID=A0ABT0MML0_9GAMM|nr:SprT family zinc-dependent metalloprotease [Luteimonas galliterrae]MCL1636131.1 M48 family metallopeptidase [Luteimonas galliterrae]